MVAVVLLLSGCDPFREASTGAPAPTTVAPAPEPRTTASPPSASLSPSEFDGYGKPVLTADEWARMIFAERGGLQGADPFELCAPVGAAYGMGSRAACADELVRLAAERAGR